MRSIIIKVLVLFSIICCGQNEGGFAIYKKKMNIPKEKIDSNKDINVQLKQSLKSMGEVINKFEYKLIFNGEKAKYSKLEGLTKEEDNKLSNKLANSVIGVNGKYYYDMVKLYSINEVNNFGDTVLVLRKSIQNKWVLTKESKVINGEICYKASTTKVVDTRKGKITREIVAWYNPKINIPVGPDGYFGLPGLIVQVEENNIITYLQEFKREKREPKINIPKKGKKMTESEYIEYVKEAISRVRG